MHVQSPLNPKNATPIGPAKILITATTQITVCGANNTVGVCKKRPEACNDGLALVCGCDGQTYTTTRTAQAAGVDVQADGECPCNADVDCRGDDRVCHENACIDRPQCPNEDICNDLCRDNPLEAAHPWCPQVDCDCVGCDCRGVAENLVCGDDGKTYRNRCLAACDGINVDYDGACVDAVCDANRPCPNGEVCDNGQCFPAMTSTGDAMVAASAKTVNVSTHRVVTKFVTVIPVKSVKTGNAYRVFASQSSIPCAEPMARTTTRPVRLGAIMSMSKAKADAPSMFNAPMTSKCAQTFAELMDISSHKAARYLHATVMSLHAPKVRLTVVTETVCRMVAVMATCNAMMAATNSSVPAQKRRRSARKFVQNLSRVYRWNANGLNAIAQSLNVGPTKNAPPARIVAVSARVSPATVRRNSTRSVVRMDKLTGVHVRLNAIGYKLIMPVNAASI